jgi:hypothetical protein
MLPQPARLHNRNAHTRHAHRAEYFWQILLPLLGGGLLMGATLVWLISSQTASISQTAQIVTIAFVMPLLVIGLILLFLVVLLTFGVRRLIQWLPPRSYRLQRGVHAVSARVVNAVDAMITPVIVVESWWAALGKMFTRYR